MATTGSRLRVAAAVALVVLLAGSCSSGSEGSGDKDARRTTTTRPDPDRAAYVDEVARSMFEGAQADQTPVTEADTECLAAEFVDVLGYDRLRAAGIDPSAFGGNEEAEDLISATIEDPDTTKATLAESFDRCRIDLNGVLVASLRTDGERSESELDCLEAALPDGFFADLFARDFVDAAFTEEAFQAALAEVLDPCSEG